MAKHRTSPEATPILQLLSDYSFDVESNGTEALVTGWLQQFEITWVSQAITEALYQGRYKVVSVDHILQFWQRRGQPLRHFNREFESIILGQSFNQITSPAKVSPAPLNFSQSQDPERPTPGEKASAMPALEPVATVVSDAPATLPRTDTSGNIPATPEMITTPPTEAEAIAPPATPAPWPICRSIPPLTPDQLARLAEPAPFAPAAENPSEDIAAPDPTTTGETAALPESKVLPAGEGETAPQPHPETLPEQSLTPGTIPNFQPIASGSTVPSALADRIPTFVPTPGPSDLHQRLRAAVQSGRPEN
ncbi:MAG: hypothetical protein VKI82_08110 [Leptolyngbya sp.]|nr:hypothetical protein [Leptolyngbya sp.]